MKSHTKEQDENCGPQVKIRTVESEQDDIGGGLVGSRGKDEHKTFVKLARRKDDILEFAGSTQTLYVIY